MELNIQQMEQLGVIDYYLTLTQYISNFVNNNYPLTMEDMAASVDDKQTENMIRRSETHRILKESMYRILMREAEENRKKIEAWNNGIFVPATTFEEQNEKVLEFVQLMLEDLWNYQMGYNNEMESNEEKKGTGRK